MNDLFMERFGSTTAHDAIVLCLNNANCTVIAAMDDSTQIHVLRRIAEGLQPYEMRDFYWTIRSMSGPGILEFRKEIRDKIGMDNLRCTAFDSWKGGHKSMPRS